MVADAGEVGHAVGGSEQRHFDADVSQCNGQIVDDPLRTAMVKGWNGKDIGSDLGDAQQQFHLHML